MKKNWIIIIIIVCIFLGGGIIGYFIGNHSKVEKKDNQYVCRVYFRYGSYDNIWIEPKYNDQLYSRAANKYFEINGRYPVDATSISCYKI